jgi:hypothetical protein
MGRRRSMDKGGRQFPHGASPNAAPQKRRDCSDLQRLRRGELSPARDRATLDGTSKTKNRPRLSDLPSLALWHFGTWHFGTLALWHSGTLALWHFGTLALWHSTWRDLLALWPFGTQGLSPAICGRSAALSRFFAAGRENSGQRCPNVNETCAKNRMITRMFCTAW